MHSGGCLHLLRSCLDAWMPVQVAAAERRARSEHEQFEALQAVVESQAQDRTASVAVIEGLQQEAAAAQSAEAAAQAAVHRLEQQAASEPGPGFVTVQVCTFTATGIAASVQTPGAGQLDQRTLRNFAC